MIAPQPPAIVRAKRYFDLCEDADRLNNAERDSAQTAVEILNDLEANVAAHLEEGHTTADEHALITGAARAAVRQWQLARAKKMGVEL